MMRLLTCLLVTAVLLVATAGCSTEEKKAPEKGPLIEPPKDTNFKKPGP